MEFEIKVTPPGNELIIREGDAPKVYDPVKINKSGIISTPGDWAAKRKDTFDVLKAHVTADYTNKTITLYTNETDQFGSSITGTLQIHPDLAKLHINENKTYTHRDLYELLKFVGTRFKSPEKHLELLNKLKKFEAKVHQEFQDANDFKGAQAQRKVVDIKTNLVLEFDLVIPLFTGGDKFDFKVDICVDTTSAGVIFWLESISMHDLVQKELETTFDKELARLSAYVIVKKW